MPKWIALLPSQHADKHYLPRGGYNLAAEQSVADILVAELPKLLPHYVLCFIKEGERFQPVALLGFGQQNLYVAPNGKWIGRYVPASLRGHPFTLATSEQGEKVFAIDAEHLTDDGGDALFDDAGQLVGHAAGTLDFLKQCERNRHVTQKAANVLGDAGVIAPWPLKIEQGEGQEPLTVNGLYRVDEKALNALEGEAYAALKGAPMALAHAQLFSMSQLNQLTELAKVHAQHRRQEVPENLDSVLDGMDDDELFF